MTASNSSSRRILIWDAPVRVFHLLLMLSFAGAWLTAEKDPWRLVHVTLGVTVLALVLWRVLWGLIGTRHARFTDFVRGPSAILAYLRGLLKGRPEHSAGHNPAGGLAIIVILVLGLLVPITGLLTLSHQMGERVEEAHEALAQLMLLTIGLHILGVLVASWLHRENLVGAMVNGRKRGDPAQAISRAWWSAALLLVIAVLGFWTIQGLQADQGGWVQPQQVLADAQKHRDPHHERGRQSDDHDD